MSDQLTNQTFLNRIPAFGPIMNKMCTYHGHSVNESRRSCTHLPTGHFGCMIVFFLIVAGDCYNLQWCRQPGQDRGPGAQIVARCQRIWHSLSLLDLSS